MKRGTELDRALVLQDRTVYEILAAVADALDQNFPQRW